MQPTENYDAGQTAIQDDSAVVQAEECAAVEGDISSKTLNAVTTAIAFMEEYAEVFEELAK